MLFTGVVLEGVKLPRFRFFDPLFEGWPAFGFDNNNHCTHHHGVRGAVLRHDDSFGQPTDFVHDWGELTSTYLERRGLSRG